MTAPRPPRLVVLDGDLYVESHGRPLVIANTLNYTEASSALALRRLAACWNACAGLPTEDLERLGGWVRGAIQPAAVVLQRHEEALAILRDVLDGEDKVTQKIGGSFEPAYVERIRKLLEVA